MGIFTKLHLLLITIVVATQISFGKEINTSIPPVFNLSLNNQTSAYSNILTNVVDDNPILNPSTLEKIVYAKKSVHFKQTLTKYKKKYRNTTVFPGLKIPIKYLDEVSIFINSIITYSKPHFLTHLHHFLFRLTPF